MNNILYNEKTNLVPRETNKFQTISIKNLIWTYQRTTLTTWQVFRVAGTVPLKASKAGKHRVITYHRFFWNEIVNIVMRHRPIDTETHYLGILKLHERHVRHLWNYDGETEARVMDGRWTFKSNAWEKHVIRIKLEWFLSHAIFVEWLEKDNGHISDFYQFDWSQKLKMVSKKNRFVEIRDEDCLIYTN